MEVIEGRKGAGFSFSPMARRRATLLALRARCVETFGRSETPAVKLRDQLTTEAVPSWKPRASVFPLPYSWRLATRPTAICLALRTASGDTPSE